MAKYGNTNNRLKQAVIYFPPAGGRPAAAFFPRQKQEYLHLTEN